MWLHFLSSWNGISFFYNDFITQPEDIQLFTDAAPSIGFGGYYGGKWFSSAWPPEFSFLDPESLSPSSALSLLVLGWTWTLQGLPVLHEPLYPTQENFDQTLVSDRVWSLAC